MRRVVRKTTITTFELAEYIGTNPKTLRRFLRARFDPMVHTHGDGHIEPGQLGRWEIEMSLAPQIKQEFEIWSGRAKVS